MGVRAPSGIAPEREEINPLLLRVCGLEPACHLYSKKQRVNFAHRVQRSETRSMHVVPAARQMLTGVSPSHRSSLHPLPPRIITHAILVAECRSHQEANVE